MKKIRVVVLSLLMVLLCSLCIAAQQNASAANATVPPLIPFSSVATDDVGNSLSGVVNITFSLYTRQQGGAPLWTETQNNIQLDATGHYSVQLGITQPNGVPTTLFTTAEARWLGVRIAEQGEQPRVLLLSVPYALKAGDAATIGGLPPSAFVLAAPASGSPVAAPQDASATSPADAPAGTVTGTGTINFIPLWTTTSNIANSVLFQSGTGATAKVGINTTTPATTLDIKGSATIRGTLSLPATGTATATKSANSQPMTLAASAFNSSSAKAVAQTFQWQAEPVGNDTATNSATLNLLFGSGTTKPAETGLNIASTGVITFNTAQIFPNTLTGVTTATGSGLIGGATSGTPSLSLLNTCTTNQVLQWNGTAWVCATVSGGGGSGTVTSVATGLGLLGGPITTSGTLTIDTTKVPQLGTANTFTGNQTVTGNVISTTGYEIQFAGTNYLFDYGSPFTGAGLGNSYLGFAGNATTTGAGNVAAGWAALLANTTGADNTAVGLSALFTNSSGIENTAVGMDALFANGGGSTSTGNGNTAVGYGAAYNNLTGYSNTAIGAHALFNNNAGVYNTASGGYALNNNTTGTYNTALGYQAGPSTGALTNTTAIGANALVSESNALVLGGTGANAVKVGIGTSAPAYTLDAAGTIRSSTGGFVFPDGTTQTTAATGGGGSITGVTAGTGLTGGGTSGNVTLSINTAVIPQLSAANTFTGNETVNGTLSASSSTNAIVGNSSGTSGYGVEGSSPAIGVFGLSLTASGSGGIGVAGESNGPFGSGLSGTNTAGTGLAMGVVGTTTSTTGFAVVGSQGSGTVVSGTPAGVYGTTGSTVGYGVEGNSPTYVGVYGNGEFGVLGTTNSTTALGVVGVLGETSSTNNAAGVQGNANAQTGNSQGVYGQAYSPAGYGILGVNSSGGSPAISPNGAPYGVAGVSGFVGVYGGSGVSGFIPPASGVWGDADGTAGGIPFGIFGSAGDGTGGGFINSSQLSETIYAYNGTGNSGGEVFVGEMSYVENQAAVLAIIGDPGCGAGDNRIAIQLSQAGMSNCNNYTLTAGNNGETYVNANPNETVHLRVGNNDSLVASSGGVNVVGTLSKGGGSFKIDHPLDPANKYLYHSFVESPDMMNIYNGNVTTDGAGLATVSLPDWFESLNRDFRYQLTVIGQFAQAIVASKVANNQFRIQTDKPNVEVSWQVTGIRQDAFANTNRIPVEVEKAPADRGHYLYPEVFGQPATARIGYEAVPPGGEQVVRHRRTVPRRSNASSTVSGIRSGPPVPPTPSMQKHILPPAIQPQPTAPTVAPLPHSAALAPKPEVNQR